MHIARKWKLRFHKVHLYGKARGFSTISRNATRSREQKKCAVCVCVHGRRVNGVVRQHRGMPGSLLLRDSAFDLEAGLRAQRRFERTGRGNSCRALRVASIQEERIKSRAMTTKKVHKKKCGTNKIRCSVTAKRSRVTYVQLRLIG